MTKPVRRPVSKLVPKVPALPGVPGASRRQQYSASTKRALLQVAEQLFAEHGYAATSLDAIVAGAQVTKGALYHHFPGKQALYEAVFEHVESESARRIRQLTHGVEDPWEKAQTGLRGFLDIVRDPHYRRIVIQDGPAVLGYERYREQEERSSYGVVEEMVHTVLSATGAEVDEEMISTFARIFFGALSSAGESVAAAADPEMATLRVEAALSFILAGLQSLADQGVHITAPAPPGAPVPD
jgi:AcrR family transcriptional regulator